MASTSKNDKSSSKGAAVVDQTAAATAATATTAATASTTATTAAATTTTTAATAAAGPISPMVDMNTEVDIDYEDMTASYTIPRQYQIVTLTDFRLEYKSGIVSIDGQNVPQVLTPGATIPTIIDWWRHHVKSSFPSVNKCYSFHMSPWAISQFEFIVARQLMKQMMAHTPSPVYISGYHGWGVRPV